MTILDTVKPENKVIPPFQARLTCHKISPEDYQRAGHSLRLQWAFHDTVLGRVLAAAANNDLCWLSFVTVDDSTSLDELKKAWPLSPLIQDKQATALIPQAFSPHPVPVNVLLRGTEFQVAVWDALLNIPFGTLTTYGAIAQNIGHAEAVRAVGQAVGANPIGFLIPCHRVIRADGYRDNYRAGAEKKRSLLSWESAFMT